LENSARIILGLNAQEPSPAALDARLIAVTHMLSELVGIVARLNVETYETEKGAFDRVPKPPRVAGYPKVEADLATIRETLESWMKQWNREDEA